MARIQPEHLIATPAPEIKVTVKNRDEVLAEWNKAAKDLAALKEREMALRKALVAGVFEAKIGTSNLLLSDGWLLKCVLKENYGFERVPKEDGDDPWAKVEEVLNKFTELAGEVGTMLADRVVKWSPELSKTEYDKLPAELQALLDTVIKISPASPELKLVPPKGK